MSRLASLKPLTIPLLAAGAAIAVFSLVAAGRREAPAARVTYGGKHDAKNKLTLATDVDQPPKAAESRPRRPVLPIAFWDIAELDADEHRPASSESYAMDDSDDSSGARWLARATQSPDGDEFDDLDDPAEIAADSMSMISEASRAAAGLDPADAAEGSEEERA
jgi:hypothetical protein